MQIQMRFGCVLGGCSDGRAMAAHSQAPPPITLFFKKAPTNTNAHDTNESHTPCATSALADILLFIILLAYVNACVIVWRFCSQLEI